jgi:hypothetical protein
VVEVEGASRFDKSLISSRLRWKVRRWKEEGGLLQKLVGMEVEVEGARLEVGGGGATNPKVRGAQVGAIL